MRHDAWTSAPGRRNPSAPAARLRLRPTTAGALFALMILLHAPTSAAMPDPGTAADPEVTIEALLGTPFPSGMTAAPEGGAVAWIENDRGVRNIWVAKPPAYEGRRLTGYGDDDGQALGSLTWTPDGSRLVYVRGGGPNRQGEIPNPASHPDGAERAIWSIPVEGGDPVRLAEGASPVMSPDGERIIFPRGGNVWEVPVDGSEEPSELFRARGGLGSFQWSPDGSRIGFVSSRGTHAFIGVFDVDARDIRWIDPSVDTDSNPVWSRDGDRIAFMRRPASGELTLFRPVRDAQPWSIRVADPETGEAVEIWRAREGPGSAFRGVVASSQLIWAEGDRIVFPWEATGWTLLYSVPASGGEATLLTPGEFEVEDVRPGPDGRTIYFNSNQDDIDRRHLWRVSAEGGPPEPLTTGDGIEWSPTPTSDGEALAFLRSGSRTPAHAVILDAGQLADGSGSGAGVPAGADARPLSGGVPADFPADALVEPEAVFVTAADGMPIPAQLFLPPDLEPGEQRPAVAYYHGGSRRQMLLGFHYGSYYHHAYALNQYLATQGYVVLSVNFRSGIGYGMEFREALGFGAAGASEFQDVQGAGVYLASRPDVDAERIGLWGGSYGGYLTALGLARASDLYAAGVDIHGVHDWNVGIETFRPDYNPLEDPEASRVAFEASPMAHLDSWESPVLVVSGDDDRNVRFLETVRLVEELRTRDVHVEQLVLPDEVHDFLLHRNWLRIYDTMVDFLDRKLGEGGR